MQPFQQVLMEFDPKNLPGKFSTAQTCMEVPTSLRASVPVAGSKTPSGGSNHSTARILFHGFLCFQRATRGLCRNRGNVRCRALAAEQGGASANG